MSRLEYSPQTTQACLEELEFPCGYCPKCAKKTEIMRLWCHRILVRTAAITTRQSSPITVSSSQDNIEQVVDLPLTGGYTFKELEEKQRADPDISIVLRLGQITKP